MHIGAVMIFEGPPPAYEDFASTSSRGFTSCRATGRSSPTRASRSGRPVWIDDPRFNLEYHVRHTALPAPGRDRAAARCWPAGSSPSGSTARSRSGSCGSCRASRATVSRSSTRPTTRSSTASRASTSRPCCSTSADADADAGGEPGRPSVEPSDAAARGRGREGLATLPARAARRGLDARAHPGGHGSEVREAAEGARRGRLERREPAADDAAQRADRPAPARAWVRDRLARLEGDQERARRHGQRRRSSRSWRARSRAGCARAACAPRGSSCAGSCRSRSARDEQRGALGNQITAMLGPLPVYADDPVERLRIVSRGDAAA